MSKTVINMETIDQILENLRKDPEHYNHGASKEAEKFDRFDDMRC